MKSNKNFLKMALGVFLMSSFIAFANNNNLIVKTETNSVLEMAKIENISSFHSTLSLPLEFIIVGFYCNNLENKND